MTLVVINLYYRKNARKFGKLTPEEEKFFQEKTEHIQNLEHSQFVLGAFKPRKWNGEMPGRPPEDLDQTIIDNGLFRINLNQKFRLFAYQKDETYFIIWLDPNHKSG